MYDCRSGNYDSVRSAFEGPTPSLCCFCTHQLVVCLVAKQMSGKLASRAWYASEVMEHHSLTRLLSIFLSVPVNRSELDLAHLSDLDWTDWKTIVLLRSYKNRKGTLARNRILDATFDFDFTVLKSRCHLYYNFHQLNASYFDSERCHFYNNINIIFAIDIVIKADKEYPGV